MHLFKNEINRKGSASWLLCNDNSRSEYFRGKFVSENGGKFTRSGRYWEWTEQIVDSKVNVDSIPDNPKALIKTWLFEDATGIRHSTTNLTEFCKTHNLSRSKIYELINKNRNTHRGYKLISIQENPA